MVAPWLGLIAGIVHVWSGPDHLAAIAPLAVRRPARAWAPGARWGLGHSGGVAVIGLLSLWLRDFVPVKLISSWGERFIGVLLIAIGFWALRKALRVHAHEHEHDGDRHVHLHTHPDHVAHQHEKAHERHTHAAFGIGILHGLGGSSHFLGVLPMLGFRTRLEAIGYLAAFAAGTILSMATFSSMMGFAARYAGDGTKFYKRLMCSCAIAAMGVGSYWLFQ